MAKFKKFNKTELKEYKEQKKIEVQEFKKRVTEQYEKYSTDFTELIKFLSSFKGLHTYSARNVVKMIEGREKQMELAI